VDRFPAAGNLSFPALQDARDARRADAHLVAELSGRHAVGDEKEGQQHFFPPVRKIVRPEMSALRRAFNHFPYNLMRQLLVIHAELSFHEVGRVLSNGIR
jgi:hypothetical protein